MLRDIEVLQASLTASARQYWEEKEEDTRFLLQTEYNNLQACKQAILWSVGWADELLSKRALGAYERDQEEAGKGKVAYE